jgi:DNA-binding NarL/FixJ family response regulator
MAGAIDRAGEQRGYARERLWETHRAALDDALRAMGARGAALYDSGRTISIGEAMALAMDDASDDRPSGVDLTRREREVADLVRQGLTDPQIAKQMFLSVRTVEGHMENLRGKLGVNTRASVAAWAAVNLPAS